MSALDDLTRLKHIQKSALQAISFVQNRSREDLENDEMLILALERLLEIIGEASNNISDDCKAKYSSIPWRQMKGMRNRLAHIYFEIDLDIVWQVVNYDLPSLLIQLNKVLAELDG